MDLATAAASIDAMLRAAHPRYPAPTVLERDKGLDRRIASGIALLAAEEEVVHVSVDQSRSTEHALVEIAAYTPSRVIRAIVSHGYLTVSTVGRHTVKSVEVTSSPDQMSDPADARYSAVAHYDELTISLPGDEFASDENIERLADFLPSLLADL